LYADSSALLKLLLDERERPALESFLGTRPTLMSSAIASVEVTRAAVIANPSSGFEEADRLLAGCELIEVDSPLLDQARRLADPSLRALDAIHLASALLVAPSALVAYDLRLLAGARRAGLATASPGA
jgi:predicted nucleic acid-binding protein